MIIITNLYLDPATGRPFAGGEQRVYTELSQLALKRDWDVWILQEAPEKRNWELPDGLKVIGSPRKRWWGRMPKDRWARGLVNQIQPTDVPVTILASYPGHLTRLVSRSPWLYQHGVNWDGVGKRDRRIETHLHKRLLKHIGGVICVDTNYANVMATNCHFGGMQQIYQKIRYIPNFQTMVPKPLPPIGHEGIRFLFPRNFVTGRGIWLVQEAAASLWKQGARFHLTFCGQKINDPAEDLKFRACFREYEAKGQVDFVQRAFMEMPQEYARCHVVLVPTIKSEGTSLSCLEAFGTGRPVIATWIGGLQNLMQDEYNGLFIAPTVSCLEHAMADLIQSHERLEAFRIGALETANRFNKERWDRQITEWLKSQEQASPLNISVV